MTKSYKLPLCKEICEDCKEGKHVFHLFGQLGDICGEWVNHPTRNGKIISISGWAEDELFLDEVMATWRIDETS